MKFIIRLLVVVLMLSGWVVAALCLHVVRVPDSADATASKFVVIPKNRIGFNETYVDARKWTSADVPSHAALVERILETGKADQFRYLTDLKSKEDPQSQLNDELKSNGAGESHDSRESRKTSAHASSFEYFRSQVRGQLVKAVSDTSVDDEPSNTAAPVEQSSTSDDSSFGFKIDF